jgi:electron transfer flavoprotein beta subunit
LRIAVCVKHAIDESELRIGGDGKPILEGAQAKMSTFDKNALEEALRLRTAQGGEVVVFTVGGPDAKKTIKEALAMGADRGTLIVGDTLKLDALRTAKLLAAAIAKAGPFDLVVGSEGSSDVYSGLVPAMLAELLTVPYVGYARKIEVSNGNLRAERSLEDSVELVEARLPSLASVVSEINEPRYPTLIQIMQAGKKPIEEKKEEDLGVQPVGSRASVLSMSAQTSSRKHVMIEGSPQEAATKLVAELEKEGVISR